MQDRQKAKRTLKKQDIVYSRTDSEPEEDIWSYWRTQEQPCVH